jgi:hypothetical protein
MASMKVILFSSGYISFGNAIKPVTDGRNAMRFLPIFPASGPFVTSIDGVFYLSRRDLFTLHI